MENGKPYPKHIPKAGYLVSLYRIEGNTNSEPIPIVIALPKYSFSLNVRQAMHVAHPFIKLMILLKRNSHVMVDLVQAL